MNITSHFAVALLLVNMVLLLFGNPPAAGMFSAIAFAQIVILRKLAALQATGRAALQPSPDGMGGENV